jgi:hypothetical protein
MPQAALAVAVWVGSTVAFAATAVGVSTGVAAAVGFATIGATLAAEVYAVNAAISAVTPKIKDPGQVVQWQADPRAGIPYPMGRAAVAGKIVFNQSAPATSRKFLNFVTVYSGVPATAFEAFQANGVTVPFTADGGEGASGYYLNRMWLKSQLGHEPANWLHWTATGSKDTPANHGGMPTEWTPQHLLTGYSATLWALEYDTGRYASGVPSPRMVGKWAKTYDPRQDSTFPGGAPGGPHRWNDERTWTWSRCPYRNGLTWAIGRRNNGQLVLGLGYDIDEIDVASFVHGMNVSDVNGWTMGGQVDSDDDPWEALKAILQAGAGYPILGGTQLSVMVNAPAVSVATISEADVVGAITVPAQVSADDRINTVWPSYTEEALDWQVVTPDAPVQVPEYVEIDGEERSIPLGMPLVQDATQAGQLSRYAIEDARELNGIVLACKPWTQWIAPGLCVTANVPSAGLVGQKLRVLKRKRDPSSMTVTFISRTETDGKHGFALGQTNTPPDTPALVGGGQVAVPVPEEDAWAIVGGVIAGASGSLPGIVIAGEADLHDAVSIVVDYRRVLPLPVGGWRSESFPVRTENGVTKTLVVKGVEPGATYQVRVRYINAKGVEDPANNTDLGNIVVGGVGAGSLGDYSAGQVIDGMVTQALTVAAEALRQGTWRIENDEILKIAGGGTLRMLQEQLGIIVNGIKTFVDFQRSVDSNGNAMWALTAQNSTGKLTGIKNLLTGEGLGKLQMAADILEIVDPDGGNPRYILRYGLDNRLILDNVYIALLEVGAVKSANIDLRQVTESQVWEASYAGERGVNLGAGSEGVWAHFGLTGAKATVAYADLPEGTEVNLRMFVNGQQQAGDDDTISWRLKQIDPDGVVTYNPRILRSSLVGKPQVICWEWRQMISAAGPYTFQLEYYRNDGEGIFYECQLTADAGKR